MGLYNHIHCRAATTYYAHMFQRSFPLFSPCRRTLFGRKEFGNIRKLTTTKCSQGLVEYLNPTTSKIDEEYVVDCYEVPAEEESTRKNAAKTMGQKSLGAFQHLPMVSCANELLGCALKKARNVGPTKGIGNIAKRERNKGAKQLDALTKELALPLRTYVEKFPKKQQLHPYEYSLIDLTFGTGKYEEVLDRVNALRKKVLDVGKNYASLCAKSTSKRDAEEILKEGFSKLEEHYQKNGVVVDELLNIAKVLRAMPVFNVKVPTLCLVGAPNVGKSSLVRVLSTGKPEVCNYPFTTRGISMGHIFVHTDVYQVTDTPGLLKRPDEERNNMEKLTLAALSYLPTAVLYVHDLTGECGVKVYDQLLIATNAKVEADVRLRQAVFTYMPVCCHLKEVTELKFNLDMNLL
ncbi:hypothetical protein KP509_31G067600 [Ceratopteris richardii]|uniref:Nucleolar GTP-binding protein 1 n=1 Tax=Ceratopteris richardii TaxID=49495 RepID=A0A8T2R0X6_CERRI|nr:hypothetical protein KP509_31G067600 [Ceratopteris richardii]